MKLVLVFAALFVVVSVAQPSRPCVQCASRNTLFFEDAYYFLTSRHCGSRGDGAPDRDIDHEDVDRVSRDETQERDRSQFREMFRDREGAPFHRGGHDGDRFGSFRDNFTPEELEGRLAEFFASENDEERERPRFRERPEGERPDFAGERHRPDGEDFNGQNESPEGERPQFRERPEGERPEGERPQFRESPEGERPEGERPQFRERPDFAGERHRPDGDFDDVVEEFRQHHGREGRPDLDDDQINELFAEFGRRFGDRGDRTARSDADVDRDMDRAAWARIDKEFCRREILLHKDWFDEDFTPSDFAPQCKTKFQIARRVLGAQGPAAYDAVELAGRACAQQNICSSPVSIPDALVDCKDCVTRAALLAEDQKYFVAFGVEGGPRSITERQVRQFCACEAHIHRNWVVSDDMSAWMDLCGNAFRAILRGSVGTGIQPFAVARTGCSARGFCPVPDSADAENIGSDF